MTFNLVCVFIIAACFNVILSAEDVAQDYQDQNIKERAVGRSYSLTTCDYTEQIGYTCLSCSRALHCYVGNVAILVDCYGIFRYCRDGRCSRYPGPKCTDNKATTPGSFNITIDTDDVATDATTKMLTDVTESVETALATGTETVIDEKSTTKSDTTTVTPVEEKTTSKSDTAIVTLVDEKTTSQSDASTTVAVDISSNVV